MPTPATAHAEVSRHKCLIYDGEPEEQLPVIVPLLMDGLETNRRCLYLGDPQMVGMVGASLAGRGVDTKREVDRGALVLSSDRSHLDGGGFDPREMISLLTRLIDDSLHEGFEGMCATGDMMWELGTETNFDRLLEYEALLERVFREKPLQGICQYHRSLVPDRAIRDALLTHRSLYVGRVLQADNLFYVPPEMLLEDEAARGRYGAWMCDQIDRILSAERKRDRALDALRESEAAQRRLAEQLAEMNRGLETRVEERTAELSAVNQELEAFVHSVSHDLRAPLRHIDGFSGMLEKDFAPALGADGARQVERVRDGVRRMNDLIESLLALSRVSRVDVRRDAVDLGALAREIAAGLRRAEPNRQVEFAIAGDLWACGDPVLLRDALENLIGNAWKFTARRPWARIEVGRARADAGAGARHGHGGRPVFFVKDDGAGFDARNAKRLFAPFHRLHSQHEFPGTGIGLATVQRIVVKHGGRIWAEAAPGRGAAFYFSLPGPRSVSDKAA